MTDYLRKKWQLLRMFRTRRSFAVDYRIIKNTARLIRGRV